MCLRLSLLGRWPYFNVLEIVRLWIANRLKHFDDCAASSGNNVRYTCNQNSTDISKGSVEIAGGEVGEGDVHPFLQSDTGPPICILLLNQGAAQVVEHGNIHTNGILENAWVSEGVGILQLCHDVKALVVSTKIAEVVIHPCLSNAPFLGGTYELQPCGVGNPHFGQIIFK